SATITVVGSNDAPVVEATGQTVAENAAGVEVATLNIDDPDSDAFTFHIVDANGVADDRFEVVQDAEGHYMVALKSGVSLDFETASTITRTVEVTDDAGDAAQTGNVEFTIHVTDVNENPGNGGTGGNPDQPDGGQGPQTPIDGGFGGDKIISTAG